MVADPSPPQLTARIVGRRVILRAPHSRDVAALRRLVRANDQYLTSARPHEPATGGTPLEQEVEQQRRQWRQDRAYSFVIESSGEPELLGRVSLTNVLRGAFQNAYLSYWIAESQANQGYATEAITVVCELAFGRLGLHRLQAAVLPDNAPSRRVLEKTGFREEGLAQGFLRVDGRWRDHVMYARTAD